MSVEFKIISHRGNLYGRDVKSENNPEHIANVISNNKWMYVEVDLWLIKNKLFLGHDEPVYAIDGKFIECDRFYIHAKNIECLEYLVKNKYNNYFYHDKDEATIVSNGEIWCNKLKWIECSILNQVNVDTISDYKKYKGICTDYPIECKNKITKYYDEVIWPFDIY